MSNYSGEYNGPQAGGFYPPHQVHPQGPYPPEQHDFYGEPQYNPGQPGHPSPNQPHQQYGENASYYYDAVPSRENGDAPDVEGPEGEKGLGSTVIGGATGGFAAHKMGGGKLATAGGAVLGAVGMNMVNHKLKQHNNQQPVPIQNVAAVPVPGTTTITTTTTGNNLGGGLDGGLLGRVHQRIARRRNGLF